VKLFAVARIPAFAEQFPCQKPHVIEALQRAHAGGAHSDGAAAVGHETLYGVTIDGDVLGVHVVSANLFALDGAEGAGAHVQRHLFALYISLLQAVQHAFREVEPGRRGGHAALDA